MNTHTHKRFFRTLDISLSFHLGDSCYPCHAHITSPGNTAGRHFPSQAGSPCLFVESDILLEGLPASGVVVPSCSSLWRCQWRSDITTFSLFLSRKSDRREARSHFPCRVECGVTGTPRGEYTLIFLLFSCQIDISTDRY